MPRLPSGPGRPAGKHDHKMDFDKLCYKIRGTHHRDQVRLSFRLCQEYRQDHGFRHCLALQQYRRDQKDL